MSKKLFSTWSTKKGWGVAASGMIAALGAIVLLQAQPDAGEQFNPHPQVSSLVPPSPQVDLRGVDATPAPRVAFDYPGVSGTVALTQGAVMANGANRLFAELSLAADEVGSAGPRRPVALAVVLDTSGSMQGQKIDEARRAVTQLLRQMRDDDRIAVVLYNDGAHLLQPLARVGTVRESLISRVSIIQAGGGTNIPQGLHLGSGAIAIASEEFVRRMVLVSDGLDHSGVPLDQVNMSVRERADQGATLSSLGVGTDYDERFLSNVADAGRGNYEFIAHGTQLASFLHRELEQASTTVVVGLTADIELPIGWHISRVYGAEQATELSGRRAALVPIGSMYAGEQRRVLLTLDVNGGDPGNQKAMALGLHYNQPQVTSAFDFEVGQLALQTVTDEREVLASRDAQLYADAMTTVIDVRQEQAVALWRQGQQREAAALSARNEAEMQVLNNDVYSSHRAARINEYQQDATNFQIQSAGSVEGRAYGLRANQARRSRSRDWLSR